MHRRVMAATGLACIAMLATPVWAYATTGSVSGGGITATIRITDAAFDGPECLQVPVQVSFTDYASLDLAASQQGSSNTITSFVYGGPGDESGTVQVCPSLDGAGTYAVRGSMSANETVTPIPAGLQFTVIRAPATVIGLTARQKGSVLRIAGKVTAETRRGLIGGDGTVTVRGMLPKALGGGGKWITIDTTTVDQFGRFAVAGMSKQRAVGALIRVNVAGSPWSDDATATTRVR